MKKLFALFLLVPSIAVAAPTKAPAGMLCAQPSGAVVVKQRCAKNEARLDLSSITGKSVQGPQGAQGPIGPQGPQGVAGPVGGLDPARCVKREQTANGNGTISTSTACLVSEFVVSSGCYTTGGNGVIFAERLSVGENSLLGQQAYQIVRCGAYDPFFAEANITVVAQALCCNGL